MQQALRSPHYCLFTDEFVPIVRLNTSGGEIYETRRLVFTFGTDDGPDWDWTNAREFATEHCN